MPGLVIQTNHAAQAARSDLEKTARGTQQAIARLSSGERLTSAADDAAGMAVATRLDARLRGYQQALRNANDAVAVLQTAESGYQTQLDLLARMRELAIQGANDAISDTERAHLQTEFADLRQEMARVAITTEYNGIPLLGAGGPVLTLSFLVGTDGTDEVTVDLTSLDPGVLGVNGSSVATLAGAQGAIDDVDGAIGGVLTRRSELGASISLMNQRADQLVRTAQSTSEGLQQVRDTDLAAESAHLARQQVLQQAGVAMIAQATSQTQLILQLIG